MIICSNLIFRWRPVQYYSGLQQVSPAGSASLFRPKKSISTQNISILNKGSQS